MNADIVVELSECMSDFCPCSVCQRISNAVERAIEEVKLLRIALNLAVGELSTFGNNSALSPEHLLLSIMDVARNDTNSILHNTAVKDITRGQS